MTMQEDEDIVMGEAGPHPPNPAPLPYPASDSVNKPPTPVHLNGGGDPSIAPSLLGSSLPASLPPRPPSPKALDTTYTSNGRGMSPPKGLAKSIEPGPATSASLGEKRDSLVEENSDWSEEDTAHGGLPLASLSTGLCYDIRMRYHCEVRPTADVHPEDPRRIYYIYKELCRAGLVDDPESSRPLVPRPLKRIDVRNATLEELSLVHTPEHYAFVESTKGIYPIWFYFNFIQIPNCGVRHV